MTQSTLQRSSQRRVACPSEGRACGRSLVSERWQVITDVSTDAVPIHPMRMQSLNQFKFLGVHTLHLTCACDASV